MNEDSNSLPSWMGWLLADMLLALSMLFLVSSTLDLPQSAFAPTPTPTIKYVVPLSSPTAISPGTLEHNYCQFSVIIDDPNRFSKDFYYALGDLEQKLDTLGILKNRQAGLVIVGVGSSGNSDVTATEIANQVYRILIYLGKKGTVFSNSSFFDPLFYTGEQTNKIIFQIYFVAQHVVTETCDPETHQQR